MDDVFPRRNLGLAEYWGRTVESRITSAEKQVNYGDLSLTGVNRTNSSSQAELARNLAQLNSQLEQARALALALPATGSAASSNTNFGLGTGWQTVTATSIPRVSGKRNLNVFATGMSRIIDPGTGGTAPSPEGFRWPFPTSTVTSEYGPRDGRIHQGIDFGISQGTPIPASNSGVISGNGFGSGTGWYVDIDHGNGIRTRNFHLVAQSDVAVGTQVAKSQTVGLVGNTGNSFGAHLHWETIVNGTHWNPRDFMAVYGDGGSGGGSGTPATYARPRARILINGVGSREFFPHRDFIGSRNAEITVNQLFPQHGVNILGDDMNVELQVYAEADVVSNPGNLARLTVFGVFTP